MRVEAVVFDLLPQRRPVFGPFELRILFLRLEEITPAAWAGRICPGCQDDAVGRRHLADAHAAGLRRVGEPANGACRLQRHDEGDAAHPSLRLDGQFVADHAVVFGSAGHVDVAGRAGKGCCPGRFDAAVFGWLGRLSRHRRAVLLDPHGGGEQILAVGHDLTRQPVAAERVACHPCRERIGSLLDRCPGGRHLVENASPAVPPRLRSVVPITRAFDDRLATRVLDDKPKLVIAVSDLPTFGERYPKGFFLELRRLHGPDDRRAARGEVVKGHGAGSRHDAHG